MAFETPPELTKHLEESTRRFEMLTEEISQPEVIAQQDRFRKLSKERANLEPIAQGYDEFRRALASYQGARQLLETENDPEIRGLAQSEIVELEPWLVKKSEELQILLLPKDPNDDKDVVLELRAAAGGDEAGLFCAELYRAYVRYAESRGWRVEMLSGSDNAAGGFKEVSASVTGDRVYSTLKYESGVHRVQRVPKTEAQGRIHTSTVTVAVMPEADEVELVIDPKDLHVETMRSGGAGGQHVNKTESAVRIVHIPTGETVHCQQERSQIKNRALAMKLLRSRILDRMIADQASKIAAERKAQVGTGMRNERIRTYNFPQGRVTDHRIGHTVYNVDGVMMGDFESFTNALTNHYQTLALKGESAVAPVASVDD